MLSHGQYVGVEDQPQAPISVIPGVEVALGDHIHNTHIQPYTHELQWNWEPFWQDHVNSLGVEGFAHLS